MHEAGHALVFDALGVPIDKVTIEPSSNLDGFVELRQTTNPVRHVLPGTLAGSAASFFVAGEPMEAETCQKFSGDWAKLREIHAQSGEEQTYVEFWLKLQTFLETWLKHWCTTNQDVVKRFASSLMEKRTLTGSDLKAALDEAWNESKPDPSLTDSDVRKVLDALLNDEQSAGEADNIDQPVNELVCFRLVHKDHDPISVGSFLTRSSDRSNQKIGKGMYFASSREDALAFARQAHNHHYTHLLTCKLRGVCKEDFVDLVQKPNLLNKIKPPAEKRSEFNTKYCELNGKKGIIWRARERWVEVLLLSQYFPGTVEIQAAEELPTPRTD